MLMKVLTLEDALRLLENGNRPTVEVVKDFEKETSEVQLQPSMKAVLLAYRFGGKNNIILDLDVSEFEEYNECFVPQRKWNTDSERRQIRQRPSSNGRVTIAFERKANQSSGLRLLKL